MDTANQFLGTEKIGSLMRKYAIPCIISLLVGALYNIVDQIFIANASYLGSYGNAANTVVFPLTVVALSIAVLVGDGCCAFVSISLGRSEVSKAKHSVGNAVILAVASSFMLTAVYLFFADTIIAMFGGTVNEETFHYSQEYFFCITLGIPFYMFGQAMNPIIRADGNPKFAMISTLLGAVINIILDPLFIFDFRWGMMGAAVATVLGQIATAALSIWYLCNNANGQTLKVKLRNSQTSQNGQYLTADGRNYQARLCRGETNYFTLYRKDGNKTVQEVNYAIRYAAQKADERHPTIGDHPPTIVTNLEGVTETTNRNFTLTVQATAYTGRSLPESNIQVYLDGKRVLQPTGNPVFEYQLRFPDPFSGDSEAHTISIRAWDGQGNSRYVSYRIIYRFVDTGDVIGTAYVVLDITTMGMGLPEEPFAVQVRQNVPASYAVMEALEEWGYEYEYSGSPDVGFYLRRISRAGFMDYPDIPENLWAKILRDGLNLTGQHDNDSLGEFDYTQGSGWMYSIGGQTYAGKGLSNYFLSSGDTLYLRFTLAYGKDIGGYDATGGNYGALSTYCGRWINGQYIDEHRWGQPQQTTAPDCTHPGQAAVTCQVCGDVSRTQEIPALGHDFQETERRDGVIIYTCSRCGERKEEPIP